jgi:hypothetical protein
MISAGLAKWWGMLERKSTFYVTYRSRNKIMYGQRSKVAKWYGRLCQTMSVETFGSRKPELVRRCIPQN